MEVQNPPLDLALQSFQRGQPASAGPALIWPPSKDQSPETNTAAQRERRLTPASGVFAHVCHHHPLPTGGTAPALSSTRSQVTSWRSWMDFVLSCFEVRIKESEASLISGFEGFCRSGQVLVT